MSANGKVDIAVLIEQHKPQLVSSGVPEHLWQTLFNKIINGVSSGKVTYGYAYYVFSFQNESQIKILPSSGSIF